jgi:hypothetical protein
MSEYIGIEFGDLLNSSTRFVVNVAGETITADQLEAEMKTAMERDGNYAAMDNIAPHVFFIRNDGWILGASARFEEVAYGMWKDEWVGYVKRPRVSFEAITGYDPEEGELDSDDEEFEDGDLGYEGI